MRLFRRFRNAMIESGKFQRYLLYALGEILLIMVAVLLAFQVSSWGQRSDARKAEMKSYENIARQLNGDRQMISNNVDYNDRFLRQFEYADRIIETEDRSKLDTLVSISLNMYRYSDFHRGSNIYETIVNSGQIELLTNQRVIDELQFLEETYVYINKMEAIHLELIKGLVIPELVETIQFSPLKIDDPDDLYDFRFKNRFNILMDIMREKNQVYKKAIGQIDGILEALEIEINKP